MAGPAVSAWARHALFTLFFLAAGFVVAFVIQRSLIVGFGSIVLLGLVAFMLRWPQAGTMFVLFVVYSNLAVAVLHFRSGAQASGPMDSGMKSVLLGSVGLVLLVPLFYYLIVRRDSIIVDKTLRYIVIFLIAMLAASVFARDEFVAGEKIIDFLIEGLILYLLIINVVRDWKTLRPVIWTVLMAGVFMGSLTIFQEATHTIKNDYWGLAQRGGVFGVDQHGNEKVIRTRAAGPIGEENRYAQILLVLIPLAIFRFRNERTRKMRLAAIVSALIISGAIVLTFSRGAFLALITVLFTMAALRYVKRSHVVAALLVGAVIVVITEPDYVSRLSSLARVPGLFNRSEDARPDTDTSALRRFAGNLASLEVWKDNPLLGVGPGIYAKYYSSVEVNRLGLVQQFKNFPSHNLYLEMAAETGVIGLVSFLTIIAYLMRRLWRGRKQMLGKDSEAADLATAFFISILGYLVSGIFEHLAYPRYFWLLIALSTVAVRCVEKEESQEPELLPPPAGPNQTTRFYDWSR